ncbi:Xanthotoxin 5-hydroxylase CYP82C4 [Citrus sinensis]|uniref:Xanthotoxin 5-hydroxylase CYP82C4 n=1 Tax=Citrus sinensis TaxID=2711 RepID=A0ACB8K9I8_CITSI|nr:Xanthotoxin 5-hydroxylase CYP82C4 [Citrus sinensis]
MDTHLPFTTTVVITAFFTFLLLVYSLLWLSRRHRNSTDKKTVPEPGGAWPLIGHLHLLGGQKPAAHVTLGSIADKHGPIFMIKLGLHRALIVSNWEIAKECFTTNDKVFCNRIKALAPEILGYNYAMFGFSPYGPYWRQIRKIATLEILSNHRLEMLKHVRESEVRTSMKELYDEWMKLRGDSGKALVEMKEIFNALTFNVATRMVVGKRLVRGGTTNHQEIDEENNRCRKAIRKLMELTGAFAIADSVPFLRWLDLDGIEKSMKRTAKELDQILEGWLEEHKQKRISSDDQVVKEENDFMDVMLSALADAEELPSFDADTITKATCLALILGGTDTTTFTLTWALTLTLNHLDVLKKVQNELDTHIGRERQVIESDIKNLVYLQAIVKETLRLCPAAPLSIPHESMEDCTIASYHVPAGTRLFVNIAKIHRDPNVWEEPNEFRPERFLKTHKDIDVRGQNFELIPFGSGRRGCPGISFALQVLLLTLASLLHGFEFATPGPGDTEPLDLSEGVGLTNLKATPLQVLLTPRLHAQLFE